MEFFSHHVLAYMWCGTSLGFWVCASSSWFFRLLFFFIFFTSNQISGDFPGKNQVLCKEIISPFLIEDLKISPQILQATGKLQSTGDLYFDSPLFILGLIDFFPLHFSWVLICTFKNIFMFLMSGKHILWYDFITSSVV